MEIDQECRSHAEKNRGNRKCTCCCHDEPPVLPRQLRRQLMKHPGEKLFSRSEMGVFEYQAHHCPLKQEVVFLCRQVNPIGFRFPSYQKGHRQVRRQPQINPLDSDEDSDTSDASDASDASDMSTDSCDSSDSHGTDFHTESVSRDLRDEVDDLQEQIDEFTAETEWTSEELDLLKQLNTIEHDSIETKEVGGKAATPEDVFDLELFSALALNILNYGRGALLRKLAGVRREMQEVMKSKRKLVGLDYQREKDMMERLREERRKERDSLKEEYERQLTQARERKHSKKTCFVKAEPLSNSRIRTCNATTTRARKPPVVAQKKRAIMKNTISNQEYSNQQSSKVKTTNDKSCPPQPPVDGGDSTDTLYVENVRFSLVRHAPSRIWAAISPDLPRFQELERALLQCSRLCKSSVRQKKKQGVEKLQGQRDASIIYCLRHPNINTRLLATAVKVARLIGRKPLDTTHERCKKMLETELPPHGRLRLTDLVLVFDTVSKHASLDKDKNKKAHKM